MERDFAAYLFTLFCPLFTSGASFSIAPEYSVRNLNGDADADMLKDGDIQRKNAAARCLEVLTSIQSRYWRQLLDAGQPSCCFDNSVLHV